MEYKRILTIQDICGVGQCSATVALPILSACGHECCVLPTAVLSTHTGGFGKPESVNLTGWADKTWRHWKTQDIRFDAVLIGYLGSREAVEMVHKLLDEMVAPGDTVIIDPAMADHGRLYSGLDAEYARAMAALCRRADILLPNITEAALLTGFEYRESITGAYVRELLNAMEQHTVILTGVGFDENTTGAMVRQGREVQHYPHEKVGGSCHGTGDIFAACFTGALMRGLSLGCAAELAGWFTALSIRKTREAPAHWYGVKFETALPQLWQRLSEQ